VTSSEALRAERVSFRWGSQSVLEDVSLRVDPGEYVTLVGPNGAGKTTLLRTLAGLESPTSGRIWLGPRDVTRVPAHRRGLGFVSQEPSLFLHRTVEENVAFGLFVRRRPLPEVRSRVAELLERLGLAPLGHRYPGELSGGEQQRVQLARALAPRPSFVLLDEPFAAADPEFRATLRAQFRETLREHGTAAVHVTHDRDEGLFLGDRVVLLFRGRIVRAGPPLEVYARPGTAEVARFLGYNLLPGRSGGPVAVAPESLRIDADGSEAGVPARVAASGPVTGGWSVHLTLADGERVEVRARERPPPGEPGRSVRLSWDPADERALGA
jgi:ABC-type Fe3+/spermidine/putrescine transport system ATPase subunit